MGEIDVQRQEQARLRDGAPPRDLSVYAKWRERAHPLNSDLLLFYQRYLVGQFVGYGSALSLEAVRSALEIDEIPTRDRPDWTQRLLYLHSIVMKLVPKNG